MMQIANREILNLMLEVRERKLKRKTLSKLEKYS